MVFKNKHSWQDVPEEVYPIWAKIFYESQEGLNLSASCPICIQKSLHCYYLANYPQEKIIDGRKYLARGDLWQWCSSCRSYVHASAAVPEWWSCSLPIDVSKLTTNPKLLEDAIKNQTN